MKNYRSWLVGFVVAVVMLSGVGKAEAFTAFSDDFTNLSQLSDSANVANSDGHLKFIDTIENPSYSYSTDINIISGHYNLSFFYKLFLKETITTNESIHDSFSASLSSSSSSFFDINIGDTMPGTIDTTYISGDTWYKYTYEFTAATTELSQLAFYFGNGDSTADSYAFIDDVLLERSETQPVPEPSTMILFGAGLIGITAWRRIRSTSKI